MSRTLLLIGTRKGAFVLESDADRRDWTLRGPYCEGWPVYHAVHDAGSGSIYAAAASEWHGSAVWRSRDLGESWELSSEGLALRRRRRPQAVEGLDARGRGRPRCSPASRRPGIFESRDGGETLSLLSTLAGQPGSEAWDDPANQPPGHLGISGFVTDGGDSERFWAIVQGIGAFETADGGATWTPRNRGLRADWPRRARGGRLLRPQARALAFRRERMYQQNHVGMHRSDDEGHTWNEITEGLPSEFGFAAAVHPHDRDTFYVIPLDPGHGRVMPDGRAAVWRTSDGGSSWRPLTNGPAAGGGAPRRAPPGDGDRLARGARASTSARAPARCSRAPTRARAGRRSPTTCRRSRRSRSPSSSDARRPPPHDADPAVRGAAAPPRGRGGDGRRGDRPARGAVAGPPRPPGRGRPGAAPRTSTSTSTRSGPASTPGSTPRSRVDVIAAISGG